MGESPMGLGPMGINPFMGFNPNPRPSATPNKMPSLADIDIDQMMRDIDKKIAELDAEEERKKKAAASKNNLIEENIKIAPQPKMDDDIIDIDFDVPSIESLKNIQAATQETKEEVKQVLNDVPKPKINVDADSIVVDNNVISDDEFFDDFFDDGDE